ncbi:TPA: phage tail protein [Escherichia coli]|nr:phage tail protein [Salmonella enterica subsp. enterica serovar Typhimurium]ECZ9341631.1 phage tail protein [Salmonella enterica subsp. enterica serovar Typhimurium]EDS5803342.1 phage tail protein [Salmonella enterica subsp. enterica]HCJ9503360.1 phage tail protein [Escherichia coli]
MKVNWLKERLTKAKQDSQLWSAFIGAMEDVWNETVEPVLTRISNRKSFFTMASEDMDTRIAEYGRFFVITENDKARRPMLLAQRLDEVHFKGTVRPIEQTFWREFGTIPVTWEPLYAPADIEKHPYGSYFATKAEFPTAQAQFGEFFLTSRGLVVVNQNKLYQVYGSLDKDGAVKKLLSDFDTVIAQLLPLHIVFDGVSFQLSAVFPEVAEILNCLSTDVSVIEAVYVTESMADMLSRSDTSCQVGNISLNAIPNRTAEKQLHLDVTPLDAWPLDYHLQPV